MTPERTGTDRLSTALRASLVIGVVGAVVGGASAFVQPQLAAEAYVLAFIFWVGVSLGSLALLMLSHATGGRWTLAYRAIFEAGAETLALMAILFIPFLLMTGVVYEWAQTGTEEWLKIPEIRRNYLNLPFFTGRGIFYFVIWLLLTFLLAFRRRNGDGRRSRIASVGLLIFFLTGTFAAFDWGMSLNPHWFSTGFGVYLLAGYTLSAVAMTAITARAAHDPDQPRLSLTTQTIHDLGNLFLLFVMFWSYMSFVQWLIIWSGNITEDISWFTQRTVGLWRGVGLSLIVLHFAIPFLALLFRGVKRNLPMLASVGVWVFVMRFIETMWAVTPAFDREGFWVSWLDVVVPIAMGGFWIAFFSLRLRRRLRDLPDQTENDGEERA